MEKVYEILKKIVLLLLLIYFLGLIFDTRFLFTIFEGEPKMVEELFLQIFHLK